MQPNVSNILNRMKQSIAGDNTKIGTVVVSYYLETVSEIEKSAILKAGLFDLFNGDLASFIRVCLEAGIDKNAFLKSLSVAGFSVAIVERALKEASNTSDRSLSKNKLQKAVLEKNRSSVNAKIADLNLQIHQQDRSGSIRAKLRASENKKSSINVQDALRKLEAEQVVQSATQISAKAPAIHTEFDKDDEALQHQFDLVQKTMRTLALHARKDNKDFLNVFCQLRKTLDDIDPANNAQVSKVKKQKFGYVTGKEKIELTEAFGRLQTSFDALGEALKDTVKHKENKDLRKVYIDAVNDFMSRTQRYVDRQGFSIGNFKAILTILLDKIRNICSSVAHCCSYICQKAKSGSSVLLTKKQSEQKEEAHAAQVQAELNKPKVTPIIVIKTKVAAPTTQSVHTSASQQKLGGHVAPSAHEDLMAAIRAKKKNFSGNSADVKSESGLKKTVAGYQSGENNKKGSVAKKS